MNTVTICSLYVCVLCMCVCVCVCLACDTDNVIVEQGRLKREGQREEDRLTESREKMSENERTRCATAKLTEQSEQSKI